MSRGSPSPQGRAAGPACPMGRAAMGKRVLGARGCPGKGQDPCRGWRHLEELLRKIFCAWMGLSIRWVGFYFVLIVIFS